MNDLPLFIADDSWTDLSVPDGRARLAADESMSFQVCNGSIFYQTRQVSNEGSVRDSFIRHRRLFWMISTRHDDLTGGGYDETPESKSDSA